MHLPTFSARPLIGAAAIACVTALATAAVLTATTFPLAPAGAAAAASTPSCTTAGLAVWLDTQGNGAAGSIFYNLELTNMSGHACTLSGYPQVFAINLGGYQIGRAASRNSSPRPRVVTLARGATATVMLQILEVGNFPGSICRPVTAAGLRVYPPNQTASKVIPFPLGACSRTGPVYLSVQAVRKA